MRAILLLTGVALAAGFILLPTEAVETFAQTSPGAQDQPGVIGPLPDAQAQSRPGQSQVMQEGQPSRMGRQDMAEMHRGMRGRHHGMRRRHERMMKIAFAIADRDGNGALSFEEISDIHRRIFNAVDENNDGLVTPDEVRNFMRP